MAKHEYNGRPVERIDPIMELVTKIWKQYPDMRLGQLISNAVSLSRTNTDIYGIEEKDLLKGLTFLDRDTL